MVGEIPSRSKCDWLRGIVDAGDDLRHAVLLARDLADDHVVLVVAGEREHDVGRARDPRPLEDEELGRVAALHLVLELVLERLEAVAPLLDQRHLVPEPEERARDVRADLAAAGDDDVHQTGLRCRLARLRRRDRARPRGVHQAVDGDARRAHGVEAALRVELRARRVEHAHDDAAHVEALLRDLADDDVRVVAVGGDDDGVGVLDAGLAQEVGVHAVPDDERAGPALAEPRERVLVLVDDGHVPALLVELERDRRADAAAADDKCLQIPPP